jgi:hypothetical protein
MFLVVLLSLVSSLFCVWPAPVLSGKEYFVAHAHTKYPSQECLHRVCVIVSLCQTVPDAVPRVLREQEQLNNALQDMAALREENDSLRAQAATLLEESKDAELPEANTEELDVSLPLLASSLSSHPLSGTELKF